MKESRLSTVLPKRSQFLLRSDRFLFCQGILGYFRLIPIEFWIIRTPIKKFVDWSP